MLSEEELNRRLQRHRLREAIVAAGRMSALRSTPILILVSRVGRLWEDADASGVLFRLCEVVLGAEQSQALADAMARLAAASDALPSRQRARVDRFLRQLVIRLPDGLAEPFVEAALDHNRQSRRRVAYKWLQTRPGVADRVKRLLRVHAETSDQEPLVFIARDPVAVGLADIDTLLNGLTERYWRARVIAALLQQDRARGLAAAAQYPVEFAHAVGRVGDPSLQTHIDALYETQLGHPEFLCLYVWALGKLGSATRLHRVLAELNILYPDEPCAANEGIRPPGGTDAP
jgi:hypothetical protein